MKSLRCLAFACFAPVVVTAAGCERREWTFSDNAPVAGGGSSAGVGGAGVAGACALDRSKGAMPVFAGQTVMNTSPARRELYAYVADADAAALRSARRLLPDPGLNAPLVVEQLKRTLASASPARRDFIDALVLRFRAVRSVWPNPWALRLIQHAASEHMNPVRVVLRSDAWVVSLSERSFVVLDVDNQPITDEAALDPSRVAGVFYAAQSGCETGFRELVLGNEAMLESWSLGTPEIAARLKADQQLLTDLFAIVRQCATVDRPGMTFHSSTVCGTWTNSTAATEYTTYGWSLANPAELYKPSGQNLVGLIDALKGDEAGLEPFVVKPTPMGAGGGGGEGGATGEAGTGGDGGLAGAGGAP